MLESSACFLLPSFYDIVYCLKLHIDCTRNYTHCYKFGKHFNYM